MTISISCPPSKERFKPSSTNIMVNNFWGCTINIDTRIYYMGMKVILEKMNLVLVHKNFLCELAMQECCSYVKLYHVKIFNCNNGKDCHDGIKFSNMCICLLIVNTIFLWTPFCYKPHFVSFNNAISFRFYFKNPLALYRLSSLCLPISMSHSSHVKNELPLPWFFFISTIVMTSLLNLRLCWFIW